MKAANANTVSNDGALALFLITGALSLVSYMGVIWLGFHG